MQRLGVRGHSGTTPFLYKKVGFRECYVRRYIRKVRGKTYLRFLLHVIDLGGRHDPVHFADEESARHEFERIVASFPKPEPLRVDNLSITQRYEDLAAREIAVRCGVTVSAMAHTYEYACKRLDNLGTIQDAVAFYCDYLYRRRSVKPRLFSDVCEEIVAPLRQKETLNAARLKEGGKQGRALSVKERLTISVLQRAAETMGGYIANHTSSDLVTFMLSQEGVTAENTVRDYLLVLKKPYLLAMEKHYMARDVEPPFKAVTASAIFKRILAANPQLAHKLAEEGESEDESAGMYCAADTNKMMYHFKNLVELASTEDAKATARGWLFTLTLRKFFGIRMSEIWKLLKSPARLVNFESNSIEITKRVSKTKEARYLSIWPIVREWLLYADYEAAIEIAHSLADSDAFSHAFNKHLKGVPGIAFVRNGLRDSAVSHLFVLTGSKSYTLQNNGHDFEMMLKHYQHSVTQTAAAEYFQCYVDPNDARRHDHPLKHVPEAIRKMMR